MRKEIRNFTKFSSPLLALLLSSTFPLSVLSKPHFNALDDEDFIYNGTPNPSQVELGKVLFFDKILSGNRNISCATCHHTLTDSGDGLSLPIGEGAQGLGVTRNTGTDVNAIVERVPRNAPPVFNLGATSMNVFFHDGRLAVDPSQPSGFFNPAGNDLPGGLDNILAAQAMFPVTSGTEMAGQAGENPIADAAAANNLAGVNGVWDLLAKRLQNIPEYVQLFNDVYNINKEDITYVHAANAIAAFESVAFRASNSPFDKALQGNHHALSPKAKKGMNIFYNKANCGECHSGNLQTDSSFHSIALPQIGPGKGDGFQGHDDFGRERVTGDINDRYKFRTPSLRNIALTAPYGHDGAFNSLKDMVVHHLDPIASLQQYNCEEEPILPSRPDLDAIDCLVSSDPTALTAIATSSDLTPLELSDKDIDALLTFLVEGLTDPSSLDLRKHTPQRVPSGLPVFD